MAEQEPLLHPSCYISTNSSSSTSLHHHHHSLHHNSTTQQRTNNNISSYQQHRYHSQEGAGYQCPFCFKNYSTWNSLKKHKSVYHREAAWDARQYQRLHESAKNAL